ncbi:MAG: hypothetical protein JW741_17920 [Sedimentisphaerales bacterium]|nr:hypothetical protein [Sedimentisphaerales bacterium]
MKMTPSQTYQTYIQLIIHAESISWTRFNNFLLVGSVLVLAWVALFVSDKSSLWAAKVAMLLISGVGVLSGIAWAGLGKRGRKYVDDYKKEAQRIEKDNVWWEKRDQEIKRPMGLDQGKGTWETSTFLVTCGPALFATLCCILFAISAI